MDFVGKMEKAEISKEAPQKEFSFFNNINYFAGPDNLQSRGLQFLSNKALLSAVESDGDHNLISREIANQSEQVDQIIGLHDNSLRRTLVGVLHRAAEEKAAKTFREKDAELEAKFARIVELEKTVSHYKAEAEWQQSRVDYMDRANESLVKRLTEMNKAHRYAPRVEDDAESSCDDPGWVEPVRLVCKFCERRPATVMVWPCRHACLCTTCDAFVNVCLVYRGRKTSTTELRLPLD